MKEDNKIKIIDRAIDFLYTKPLRTDMRTASALIEELKLLKHEITPAIEQSESEITKGKFYQCGRFEIITMDDKFSYLRVFEDSTQEKEIDLWESDLFVVLCYDLISGAKPVHPHVDREEAVNEIEKFSKQDRDDYCALVQELIVEGVL